MDWDGAIALLAAVDADKAGLQFFQPFHVVVMQFPGRWDARRPKSIATTGHQLKILKSMLSEMPWLLCR